MIGGIRDVFSQSILTFVKRKDPKVSLLTSEARYNRTWTNFGKQNWRWPLALRVYVQDVPVFTGTTLTCSITCAPGAGIHGDVLHVHTEAFSKPNTGFPRFSSVPQHTNTHQTHTTTTHNTTTTTTHHTTQHTTSHGDREKEWKRERSGKKTERETRQEKTIQYKKTREDEKEEKRREKKRREEKREEEREEKREEEEKKRREEEEKKEERRWREEEKRREKMKRLEEKKMTKREKMKVKRRDDEKEREDVSGNERENEER